MAISKDARNSTPVLFKADGDRTMQYIQIHVYIYTQNSETRNVLFDVDETLQFYSIKLCSQLTCS